MLQLVRSDTAVTEAPVVSALRVEERILDELSTALASQRDAIAADDPHGIEAATHLVSRAVLTLDEARRRREQLTLLLTEGASAELESVERCAGPVAGLDDARNAVRTAARATVRNLALNQSILRGALRAGDAYLQALFATVADISPAYTASAAHSDRTAPSGVVLNRRA